MRIVIDMQGAQTESRFRGIGRFAMSLSQAMVRNRGHHDIILALSGLFPDTIEPIRGAFEDLLPQDKIHVWFAPGPVRECDPNNTWRREVAERIREAFLLSLRPDIVLITSLFEGVGDDAVTSVGVFDQDTPTAVILHDLIPLTRPDKFYRSSDVHKRYYARKIDSLIRSQCLLANSESSRQEAIRALPISEDAVVTISAACNPMFRQVAYSSSDKDALYRRFGISAPFIMYTGGSDERKNLHRLIDAYADLPNSMRQAHQLVFVGKMPPDDVASLKETAKKNFIDHDILFTGYVTDKELIQFYNSCKLFVFPSLHEGFGMPPLEAMACGAPVIAARATSLPEIVGYDDALFDPESVPSIRAKMAEALHEEALRNKLIGHGLTQVNKFSWESSARKALNALERFHQSVVGADNVSLPLGDNLVVERTSVFGARKKQIILIKLDHMGDLLLAVPAISRLQARYPQASLDVIVGSWNLAVAEKLGLFRNIYTYDFFKRSSSEPPAADEAELSKLLDKLRHYDIAIDLRRPPDTRFLLGRVSADLKVAYQTLDPKIDATLDIALKTSPDVPFLTTPLNETHISEQLLKLVESLPPEINDYVSLPALETGNTGEIGVALFPKAGNAIKEWDIEKFKELSERLSETSCVDMVDVYFASAEEAGIAGFKSAGKIRVYSGLVFAELIASLAKNKVCVANNSFGAHLGGYLGLTVIAIFGGHETAAEWAPAFGDSYVIRREVACSPCHHARRSDCREGMRCLDISVDVVYNKIVETLRCVVMKVPDSGGVTSKIRMRYGVKSVIDQLLESIAATCGEFEVGRDELTKVSDAIARSVQCRSETKQLLVDVSEIIHHDIGTGIQRVVRNILKEWLKHPPAGYRVEPVYATTDQGYWYARRFTQKCITDCNDALRDEPIEYRIGDVFFGLDLQPDVISKHREFYQELRRQGVRVVFGVHDLLCIQMPQYFPPVTVSVFARWLTVIAESDGVVCVSRAVADQFAEWFREHSSPRWRPFKIGWSHNGADIENSAPRTNIPAVAYEVLQALRARPSFLMVGTIEPRKGHRQTLSAFERLWSAGQDLNLVVVGKQGWSVDQLIGRFRSHPELNRRLFWLDGISDEYLEAVYAASTCLIAASEGEGFGLPLVESARHKLPVIARDLAVFREVAAEHAFYFEGKEPEILAAVIKEWLALYARGKHPRSDAMPWLTWEQSAERLQEIVLKEDWYTVVSAQPSSC